MSSVSTRSLVRPAWCWQSHRSRFQGLHIDSSESILRKFDGKAWLIHHGETVSKKLELSRTTKLASPKFTAKDAGRQARQEVDGRVIMTSSAVARGSRARSARARDVRGQCQQHRRQRPNPEANTQAIIATILSQAILYTWMNLR